MNHPTDIFTPGTSPLARQFKPLCIDCPTLCGR